VYTHAKYWTEAQRTRLQLGIEEGLSTAAIARALPGRTRTAVNVYCKRHVRRRQLRPLSARDVATLMGWSCGKKAARLVRSGALRGQVLALHAGPNRRFAVEYGDLELFLEDRRYWPAWDPQLIADRRLRAHARIARPPSAASRYLTPGEVARRFYVGCGAVNEWIQRGLLPAVRHGNWRIAESAVEDFVPPNMRPSRPRAYAVHRFTAAETASLMAMRAGGATWAQIADAFGLSISSVWGRYKRELEYRSQRQRPHGAQRAEVAA